MSTIDTLLALIDPDDEGNGQSSSDYSISVPKGTSSISVTAYCGGGGGGGGPATYTAASGNAHQHNVGGSGYWPNGGGTAVPTGVCSIHGSYVGPFCPTCTSGIVPYKNPWTVPGVVPKPQPSLPAGGGAGGAAVGGGGASGVIVVTAHQEVWEILLEQGAAVDVVTGEMYQGPWKPFPGEG
jgi:hypothetical protein